MSTIQELLEFISSKDKKSDNNKFPIHLHKKNPNKRTSFNYVTSISNRDIQEMTFKDLDSYKQDTKKFTKVHPYMYEYIKNDLEKGNYKTLYYHLFLDIDSFTNTDEFDQFIDDLDKFSTLGSYTLGGYTSDKQLAKATGLRYIKDTKKPISLHACFYETCISQDDYLKLINPQYNKLAKKEGKDLKLNGISQGTDPAIYSFLNTERLMRVPLSNKKAGKHTETAGTVIAYDNDEEKWMYANTSDNLITCKGGEDILTLRDLYNLKLFEPTDACTTVYTPDVDPKHPNLNKHKQTNISTTESSTIEPMFDDPELNILVKILYYIKPDDNTYEDLFHVMGIVTSATGTSFSTDDLYRLFYWWFNTSVNEDGIRVENKHNDDSNCVKLRLRETYDKKDPKYSEYTEDSYLHGLIKEVTDKKIQINLKKLVEKYKSSSFKIKPNNDYRDALTIKYISPNDIRACRTRTDKLNLIATTVRYCHGLFIHMIGREDYPEIITEDKLQRDVMETFFSKNECSKVMSQIKMECSCEGKAYQRGFQFKHLYKGNPLANIKDEQPDTKQQHIDAFVDFIETNIDGLSGPDVAEFRTQYIAWRLHNPGKPSGIIEYIHGDQGTGKTLYGTLIAKLFDDAPTVNFWDSSELVPNSPYISIGASVRDFTHNFNDQTDYHVYDLINETTDVNGTVADGRSNWNEFKRLNDPVKRSEGKGKQTRFIENTTNITVTTNNLFSVVPDYDDRRLFAVTANPKYNHKNTKYWKKILDKFSEPYFVKHVYDYLIQDVDISKFNSKLVPTTETTLQIKEKSLTTLQEFYVIHNERCIKGLDLNTFIEYCTTHKVSSGKYGSLSKMWSDYVTLFTDGIAKPVTTTDELTEEEVTDYMFFPNTDLLTKYNDLIKIKAIKFIDNSSKECKAKLKKANDDLEVYIQTKIHTKETRQSKYNYVLSNEIDSDKRKQVTAKLLNMGYVADKHLENPDNGKRTANGWKLALDDN